MTTLTNKQKTAIEAYLAAWIKYEKVKAIQAGERVDDAAHDVALDAAEAVTKALGIKEWNSDVAPELVLDLLVHVDNPPRDGLSVASVVCEIAEADKVRYGFVDWCKRHPESRTAKDWVRLRACKGSFSYVTPSKKAA
jgi:hypothetical protein